MCADPISILAIGSTILGTAGSLYSASQQASAAREQAQLQQQQYQAQAAAQRNAANQERMAGMIQARRLEDKAVQLRGQQRNAFASAGVLIDDGSPVDVMLASADEAALDRAIIGFNSDAKAIQQRSAANQSEFAGNVALRTGEIKAETAWTTGVANAFSNLSNGLQNFGTNTKLGRSFFN